MATTRLTKTFSGNGDRQKFTLSMWIKRSSTSQNFIFTSGSYNSTSMNQMYFDNSGILAMYTYNSSGSVLSNIETNRKFRDTSAWYHIVLRVDTTQSTAADRLRLYVNGIQETSLASTTYPSQNANYLYSESITAQYFGQRADAGNSSSFDGSMSHIHMCDGYSYDASSFGETDSTTGEWKIKTSPSVSYGTNGYWILKDGNSLTDASPNSNNFTLGAGTLTNTEDNPSNNFAAFNRTDRHPGTTNNYGDYLTYLGTKITIASAQKCCLRSTIGVTSGKYYWEAKVISKSKGFYGVCNSTAFDITSASLQSATSYSGLWYYENGPNYYSYNNSTNNTSIASVANNDILGFALDMDNYAFYIHKNGTYMNSGSPTSGGSRTGSIAELFTYGRNVLSDKGEVFVNHFNDSGSGGSTVEYNFGNGYFGVTAISSEGSNASGIGKFEYDVPAGYTALSTKGLNE